MISIKKLRSLPRKTRLRKIVLLLQAEERDLELGREPHRDYLDSHREVSPLRRAEDAIALDNSDMGLKEQFDRVLSLARRVIEKKTGA